MSDDDIKFYVEKSSSTFGIALRAFSLGTGIVFGIGIVFSTRQHNEYYTTFTNFSMKYHLMYCKVDIDVGCIK